MKLLVNQYVENGAKLVEDLSRSHEERNTLILKLLETKKTDILNLESKTHASISEIIQGIQENRISDTVKQWERLQDDIRIAIDEGMRNST